MTNCQNKKQEHQTSPASKITIHRDNSNLIIFSISFLVDNSLRFFSHAKGINTPATFRLASAV